MQDNQAICYKVGNILTASPGSLAKGMSWKFMHELPRVEMKLIIDMRRGDAPLKSSDAIGENEVRNALFR